MLATYSALCTLSLVSNETKNKTKMNSLENLIKSITAPVTADALLNDNSPSLTNAEAAAKYLAVASVEDLDEIVEDTDYAVNGVAIGAEAGRDAWINVVARAEAARRMAL